MSDTASNNHDGWTATYDGGRIVASRGFTAWLAAHDAELREQIAREIETRQWAVASTHHFGFGEHGWTCLCGFKSPVNRQRTEHIIAEIDADRIARGEKP